MGSAILNETATGYRTEYLCEDAKIVLLRSHLPCCYLLIAINTALKSPNGFAHIRYSHSSLIFFQNKLEAKSTLDVYQTIADFLHFCKKYLELQANNRSSDFKQFFSLQRKLPTSGIIHAFRVRSSRGYIDT